MRSRAENISLRILRVLLAPVALFGLFLIWIYVLLTLGFHPANGVISEILDL